MYSIERREALGQAIKTHQSHEAVRAVTLNGLFAQKAGVPQDVSSRPVLLEILMCLNRLTKCFSPLNAVHLSICNRSRKGKNEKQEGRKERKKER